MSLGADPANSSRDPGHLLDRAPHAELLEAPQFGDAEVGIGHVTVVVHEDVDPTVAFQPGYGVDLDRLHGLTLRKVE